MSASSGAESASGPAGRTRLNPVRQASMREHNLVLVLAEIAHQPQPPSRADIAQITGLTRTTVSALVDQLIASGIVSELPTVRSPKAGRPAVPLVPATGTMAAVGLEVNVDYLGVRVLDLGGAVIVENVTTGDYRNSVPDQVLPELAALYRATTAALTAPVAGVCIALPGLVDTGAGPLRVAPNLGWRDVDVAALLATEPGCGDLSITLANEAGLAAAAEAEALRHSDIHSFFYVSGEIGIGGALVGAGRIEPGSHGWSGEIGHTLVDPAGPRCGCGARGCLEQYAGKDALLRRAGLDVNLPIAALVARAEAGAGPVLRALGEAGAALGVALSNAINLIDVDTVILGGSYAPITDYLISSIREQLALRVLWQPWAPVRVQAAQATDYPALTGAALTIVSAVLADPSSWMDRAGQLG